MNGAWPCVARRARGGSGRGLAGSGAGGRGEAGSAGSDWAARREGACPRRPAGGACAALCVRPGRLRGCCRGAAAAASLPPSAPAAGEHGPGPRPPPPAPVSRAQPGPGGSYPGRGPPRGRPPPVPAARGRQRAAPSAAAAAAGPSPGRPPLPPPGPASASRRAGRERGREHRRGSAWAARGFFFFPSSSLPGSAPGSRVPGAARSVSSGTGGTRGGAGCAGHGSLGAPQVLLEPQLGAPRGCVGHPKPCGEGAGGAGIPLRGGVRGAKWLHCPCRAQVCAGGRARAGLWVPQGEQWLQ